ncbi:hypothetical protein NDU88_001549 [Pleurodeles waltl]|uniref:Uncharacterized protein n=1 Tax=Pleurodeles waltl TaxID=8319 RepID=A0AAV7KRR9_PLEWA|nr:hypothetical protein NDU88_001549 [Pleurodeles waltl]
MSAWVFTIRPVPRRMTPMGELRGLDLLLEFAVAPIPGRQVSFSWGEEAGRHWQRITASPPGRPLFGSNQPGGGAPNIQAAPTAPATKVGISPRRSSTAHRARSSPPGPASPRPPGRRRGRSSARRPRTGAQSATGPPPTHGAKGAPAIPGQAANDPSVSRRASGPRGKPA